MPLLRQCKLEWITQRRDVDIGRRFPSFILPFIHSLSESRRSEALAGGRQPLAMPPELYEID